MELSTLYQTYLNFFFGADIDVFDGLPVLGLKSLYRFAVKNRKQSILQKLFEATPNLEIFLFWKGLGAFGEIYF